MVGMENEEIVRTVTVGQADITSMLCNLLKQQSAPALNVDGFDGNPLKYRNFMALLHELVEKRIDDPRGRLTRLIIYTKSDPKDMIQHCVQQPPSDGESYQKFYKFLLKCESITQAREWNPLDTPDVIYMLLSKLPGVIRDKRILWE